MFFLHTVVRQGNEFRGMKPNQIQMVHGMLFRRTYVQYSDLMKFGPNDFRPRTLGNGVEVGPEMDIASYSRYIRQIDPTFNSTVLDKAFVRDIMEISDVQDRMLLLYMFQRFSVCVCVCVWYG